MQQLSVVSCGDTVVVLLLFIILTYLTLFNTKHNPHKEGSHSSSFPNDLLVMDIISSMMHQNVQATRVGIS